MPFVHMEPRPHKHQPRPQQASVPGSTGRSSKAPSRRARRPPVDPFHQSGTGGPGTTEAPGRTSPVRSANPQPERETQPPTIAP
jgi:hypothetical protein